ncbi:MAG: DUF1569 domain-containing protein [Myxococcota bacterium]
MDRRRFLKRGALGVGVLAVGGSAVWIASGPGSADATTAWSRKALDELEAQGLQNLRSSGAWSPAQIFVHLAQSIEYSMSGYPELRAPMFRGTLGRTAFAAFSARGQIVHGRSDPIPGAEPLPESAATEVALKRLRDALDAFEHHEGTYEPHFAYGTLARREYEIAHALHLRDHLVEFESA